MTLIKFDTELFATFHILFCFRNCIIFVLICVTVLMNVRQEKSETYSTYCTPICSPNNNNKARKFNVHP